MRSPDARERAVWITGVGAATPLGHEAATIADNLLAGHSAVRRVDRFRVDDHPSQVAAMLPAPIPCPEGFDRADFERRRPLERLVLWTVSAALRDSGWWDRRSEVRVGLVLGLGAEWLLRLEDEALAGSPTFDPQAPGEEGLAHLARHAFGLTGPTLTLSAACASGNHALAMARRWLELGWADVCVAGGCDMAVTPMAMASFGNLRALTRRNDRPEAASRPFDKGRDGFVIGEGGVVFVLETAASARRRGANALAEVAGCGSSSDAFHPVIPSPDPRWAIASMRQALADARLDPADIDYVNAHATSTPVGDAIEAAALRSVLGESCPRIPVSSTKSMTGHLVTAAGAFEALACITAMNRGAVPPTVNLDEIDPDCDLCHVPHEAREHRVKAAVSNSFGFGGSNTCLVLRAV